MKIPVLLIIRTVGTQEDRETEEREYSAKHKAIYTMKNMYKCEVKCEGERKK